LRKVRVKEPLSFRERGGGAGGRALQFRPAEAGGFEQDDAVTAVWSLLNRVQRTILARGALSVLLNERGPVISTPPALCATPGGGFAEADGQTFNFQL